jgi:hypothetical protein
MPAVPIRQAAQALGKSPATIRRWISDGAPCARPGTAGRGRGALVEVAALERWREAGPAPDYREFLVKLEPLLSDYHRSGDHKYIGLRDDAARAYLQALYQYVADRLRDPDDQANRAISR